MILTEGVAAALTRLCCLGFGMEAGSERLAMLSLLSLVSHAISSLN
jgi:hypothetical protein